MNVGSRALEIELSLNFEQAASVNAMQLLWAPAGPT